MSVHEYARRERQRVRRFRVTLGCSDAITRVRIDHARNVAEAVRTAQRMLPGWTALVAEEV